MREVLRIFLFTLFLLPLTTGAYAVGEGGGCNTTDKLCDAALYCSTEGSCEPCAVGSYSAAGATSCGNCQRPSTLVEFTSNGTTAQECSWKVNCPAGQRWGGSACTACGSGTFSTAARDYTGTGSSVLALACPSTCGASSSTNADGQGCTCNAGYHTSGQVQTHTANNATACVVNSYVITYSKNDGTATPATATQSVDYLATFTPKATTTFSRTGYTFRYWYAPSAAERPNSSISFYYPSSTYTYNTTTESKLNAIWQGVQFTIKYEANGASGSSPSYPTSCVYGSSCPAPQNTYTYSGRAFTGWKCTGGANGKCSGNIIQAGDTDTLKEATTAADAEITLTAQWKECPAGYYCSGVQQTACDGGTTSPAGSTSRNACYIKGGTKFCDDADNCFYLPKDVPYSY
ncbi:MAG: InlB B-repeat-containing protein [Rickettsiales bacterium]|nr:InlB B-repeat-containing protein [Rickettsiales bacterium]